MVRRLTVKQVCTLSTLFKGFFKSQDKAAATPWHAFCGAYVISSCLSPTAALISRLAGAPASLIESRLQNRVSPNNSHCLFQLTSFPSTLHLKASRPLTRSTRHQRSTYAPSHSIELLCSNPLCVTSTSKASL